MDENRKQLEMEHYDSLARKWYKRHSDEKLWDTDIEEYDVGQFLSYQYFRKLIEKHIGQGMEVLDYGCGHGMHSILPAKLGANVCGIDISESSLEIARERVMRESVSDRVRFLNMDVEKLDFRDNSFDVVIDGGTFSSIDINRAYVEISRVLKPGGLLLGIETFGHNPLINFKRWINRKSGIRTNWAATHIFKNQDIKNAEKYFNVADIRYFHLLSILNLPFERRFGLHRILKIFDRIDTVLFMEVPFFKMMAFKTVFVFEKKNRFSAEGQQQKQEQ